MGAQNRERGNWFTAPAMIVGAFIIDLLLLAYAFIGQMLSDNFHAGSRTIAFLKACS